MAQWAKELKASAPAPKDLRDPHGRTAVLQPPPRMNMTPKLTHTNNKISQKLNY